MILISYIKKENADTLSRIEINSDILKNMIPISDEETASKKLLPITRSMAKERQNFIPDDVSTRNKDTHGSVRPYQMSTMRAN